MRAAHQFQELTLNVGGDNIQQELAMRCADKEQLGGGAKRGGKSVWLCRKGFLLAYYFPGNRGILARQSGTDLRDSTLETWKQVIPAELFVHHKSERRLEIKTQDPYVNSSIIYRGLADDNVDVSTGEKSKGIDVGFILIDEPSEIEERAYLMLLAQLNWRLPDGSRPPYMALLASNPEPGWVKRRFIDKILGPGMVPQSETVTASSGPRTAIRFTNPTAPGRTFIPFLPKDNPYLPAGYEAELRNSDMPLEWVQKYLDGNWDVGEGQVFTEFDRQVHVIPAFDWRGLKRYADIDHGTTGVTCMMIHGMDGDGNAFALHEYYKRDGLIVDHAAEMKALERLYAPLEYTLIDPSTTAKTLQGKNQLQSVQELYLKPCECEVGTVYKTGAGGELVEMGYCPEHGIITIPGINAVEAGLQRFKMRLHVNPHHLHPLKLDDHNRQVRGAPHYFIVGEFCPNHIREIIEYKRKITPRGQVQYVGDDHSLDPTRYWFNSIPDAPRRTERDEVTMSPQLRAVVRSHDRWTEKFDKSATHTDERGRAVERPGSAESWF